MSDSEKSVSGKIATGKPAAAPANEVTLQADGKSVALPVLRPTIGNDCVDIARLPKETGLFTYDSGFTATASCKSAITYIDAMRLAAVPRSDDNWPNSRASSKSPTC